MEIYLHQTITMFTQNLSIGTSFSILRTTNMDKQQRGHDNNDLVFESCLAINVQSSIKL